MMTLSSGARSTGGGAVWVLVMPGTTGLRPRIVTADGRRGHGIPSGQAATRPVNVAGRESEDAPAAAMVPAAAARRAAAGLLGERAATGGSAGGGAGGGGAGGDAHRS